MKETRSAGGTHNAIAGETTIVGKVIASQDIRVDGELEGRLECQGRVIVGTNGRIWGDVVAESADVAGRIVGNVVVSGTLVLKASARLDGDVTARRLAIEPQATLNSKCVMINESDV